MQNIDSKSLDYFLNQLYSIYFTQAYTVNSETLDRITKAPYFTYTILYFTFKNIGFYHITFLS